MKSNNTIAISKSCFPKDQISYADWVRQFNVGTNAPLNYGRSIKCDLNKDYDFSRLFKEHSQSKSIFDLSWILERLNIFA